MQSPCTGLLGGSPDMFGDLSLARLRESLSSLAPDAARKFCAPSAKKRKAARSRWRLLAKLQNEQIRDYFSDMRPLSPFLAAVLLAALSFTGCDKKQSAARPAGGRVFNARGIVRGVDSARGAVTIEHEDVPG